MIDLSNWNYCHYSTGPLKSMISLGQGDGESESEGQHYWLTILQDCGGIPKEVYQDGFRQLPDAVAAINHRHGHWDFIDTSAPSTTGGCGDCSNA